MKYKFAIYFEDSEWKKIEPQDLYDTDLRAKLRGHELFDKDKKFRLYIRFRKDCPHFFSRGLNRQNFTSDKDTEKHNEVINILTRFLSKHSKIEICYYDWPNYDKEKDKKPPKIDFYKLADFDWKTEIKHVISKDGYVRADIVGRSNTFEISDKNPIVILEIIHTHFLTFEAFDRYRYISENLPLTILIYFVQGYGKYNHMENSKRSDELCYLRVSFYIMDGSFWIHDERFEEVYPNLEQCDLINRVDYFNAVKEFKIREILNNKNAI